MPRRADELRLSGGLRFGGRLSNAPAVDHGNWPYDPHAPPGEDGDGWVIAGEEQEDWTPPARNGRPGTPPPGGSGYGRPPAPRQARSPRQEYEQSAYRDREYGATGYEQAGYPSGGYGSAEPVRWSGEPPAGDPQADRYPPPPYGYPPQSYPPDRYPPPGGGRPAYQAPAPDPYDPPGRRQPTHRSAAQRPATPAAGVEVPAGPDPRPSLPAVLSWTASAFLGPILLYLGWAFTRSNTAEAGCVDAAGAPCPSPRVETIENLIGVLPALGVALVLAMLVAVGLRRIAASWRAATIGLAAAVIGAGLATVVTAAF